MPVREARIEDAADIARIHVESWKSTYPGILPDDVLLRLKNSRYEVRWWESVLGQVNSRRRVFVAEIAGEGVVGFASGGKSRDSDLSVDGEIYALYLLDHAQGQGLGKALLARLGEALHSEYGPRVGLWVVRENPARFFYEAMGGKRAAVKSDSVGGKPVAQIAYRWEDANMFAPQQVR